MLINNRSALECWERGLARDAVLVEDCSQLRVCGAKEYSGCRDGRLAEFSRPIEVLASAHQLRSYSREWTCRFWSKELPKGSVYRIPHSPFAISAPWFCFLQMAARMPFGQAMLLGMELCGNYSTLPFSHSAISSYRLREWETRNGYVERKPLISPEQLVAGISAAVGAQSESKALAAARRIQPNAFSPGESRYAIRLFSPVKRGGYGLPPAFMNVPIPLPERLRRITGRGDYIIDFYYPKEQLAIEFDGGYHWNGKQRLDDNLRELVLNDLGIDVIRVDKHQLESQAAMEVSVRTIAKRIGFRVRKPSDSSLEKRSELQKQILDFTYDLYA